MSDIRKQYAEDLAKRGWNWAVTSSTGSATNYGLTLSARDTEFRYKCEYCGQYGRARTACLYCGAPIDSKR